MRYIILILLITSVKALELGCNATQYQGPDHCDICDIESCLERIDSLDCHVNNQPRERFSDSCGTACGVGKTIREDDYFTCVQNDVDCTCDIDNLPCNDGLQTCPDDQLSIGNGQACPVHQQTCISDLSDYKSMRQRIKTQNYKSAKYGSKSVFRAVVEPSNSTSKFLI